MKYIKNFLQPNERAANEMTTRLHSISGMANLFGLLPKSLPSKHFKYGLNIATKETH